MPLHSWVPIREDRELDHRIAIRLRIEGETRVGDRPAIISSIEGSAGITGTHQHMLDPSDSEYS